jgi:hypothetical protein
MVKETNWLGAVVNIHNPSYLGGWGRRIAVQGQPRQKLEWDPIWKKWNKSKKTRGVFQVVESLLSKCKNLSSTLRTERGKKQKWAEILLWASMELSLFHCLEHRCESSSLLLTTQQFWNENYLVWKLKWTHRKSLGPQWPWNQAFSLGFPFLAFFHVSKG